MEVTHVCVLLLMFWSGIGDAHVISNGFEGCSEHSNHNVSCGSVLNGIKGYFVNPDYPNDNADPGNCNIRINITRNDICQVRLDFLDFELAQPDVDGKCKDDFFMGFNEAGTMPVLCGSIKEQHMYWDVVTKPSMMNLSIYRSPFRNGQRRWNIQIEQIPCCSRVPKGCLQYYKGISGTVESFNFQGNMTTYEGTPQIAELKYAACVEKVDGYCGIAWERNTAVGDMSFTVSGNAYTLSPGLIGTPDASATDTADCIDDYVIIPGGVDSSGIIADRYCGLGFPIRVYSTHQPFTLYTVTDDNEMPDAAATTGTNGGFSLNYQQITC